jgi:hypothetical protein
MNECAVDIYTKMRIKDSILVSDRLRVWVIIRLAVKDEKEMAGSGLSQCFIHHFTQHCPSNITSRGFQTILTIYPDFNPRHLLKTSPSDTLFTRWQELHGSIIETRVAEPTLHCAAKCLKPLSFGEAYPSFITTGVKWQLQPTVPYTVRTRAVLNHTTHQIRLRSDN